MGIEKRKILIVAILVLFTSLLFSPFASHMAHAAGEWLTDPMVAALKAAATSIFDKFLEWNAVMVLGLLGWVLWFSSAILNKVVLETIVNMSTNIGNIGGINIAWTAMRDLANMCFIFILLYIAISTILRGSSFNTKQLLAKVIIVALLINFSLFFTKVIIDISNTVALGFYNSIGGSGTDITVRIMEILGLNTLTKIAPSGLQAAQIIVLTVMGGVFILITSFVFLAVAVLFLIRYVVLIVLMILSPLAYIATLLPTMESHGKKWWSTLFAQCIFAPAFMALLWVSLQLLAGVSPLAAWADITGKVVGKVVQMPDASAVTLMFNFILVMGFMIASLLISKYIGVAGASTALAWGKKVRQGAQGIVGRNTLGRTARAVNDSATFKNVASRVPLLGGAASRGLDKVSGYNFGDKNRGRKGGFDAARENRAENAADFAEHVGTPAGTHVGMPGVGGRPPSPGTPPGPGASPGPGTPPPGTPPPTGGGPIAPRPTVPGGPAGTTPATRALSREQIQTMGHENVSGYVTARGGVGNIHESDLLSIGTVHAGTEIGNVAKEELRRRGILGTQERTIPFPSEAPPPPSPSTIQKIKQWREQRRQGEESGEKAQQRADRVWDKIQGSKFIPQTTKNMMLEEIESRRSGKKKGGDDVKKLKDELEEFKDKYGEDSKGYKKKDDA